MSITDAMEYITDLINIYLNYLPISVGHKKALREALNLALGALKTIDDMQTKGK